MEKRFDDHNIKYQKEEFTSGENPFTITFFGAFRTD